MAITKISPDVVDFDSTLTLTAADTDTVDSVSNAHLVLTDDGDTAYWKVRMGTTNRYLGIDGLDSSTWKEVIAFDRTEQRVGIGTSNPAYGLLDVRQTGTGAQDRCLWLDMAPASSGSNNNAMVINVGNANMTNTVMRIHHESPAANQKLLSLDTTGSNTEKFWVDEDGDAYLAGNLAFADGQGIDFSATSNIGNVTGELFNDYEEGNIEPTVTGSSSGSFTLSSTGNSYAYTKIGQRVFISGYLTITGGSGSGSLRISMPFTTASMTDDQGYSFGSGLVQNNGTTVAGQKYVIVSDGANYFDIYQVNDAGSAAGFQAGDCDTSFQIGFDFSFIAA